MIAASYATLTVDNSTQHDHDAAYFENAEERFKASLAPNQVLTVHLVPHSHDDVGWLKTVDEYYTGSNQQKQWASVEYIISNVVTELLKDPARRFSQVEMKFFTMWWKYQTDDTKNNVRMLVK